MMKVIIFLSGLWSVVSQCSDTSPTCSYAPDDNLPIARLNMSVSAVGDRLCVFGGATMWDCSRGENCMIEDVQCLDPYDGTQWLTGYDPQPFQISGKSFSCPLTYQKALLAAAGTIWPEDEPPDDSLRDFYVFDPTQNPGLQWSTLSNMLPEHTASAQIIRAGDDIYILGGVHFYTENNVTTQYVVRNVYKWSTLESEDGFLSNVTQVADIPIAVTDFAVATDGMSIFVIGGYERGHWSDRVFKFSLKGSYWQETKPLTFNLPYPNAALYGPYLYVVGDDWEAGSGHLHSLYLYVMDGTTEYWSRMELQQVPGPRRKYAACSMPPFGGNGSPQLYLFGGLDTTNTENASVTVGHIKTGISLPRFTVSPSTPMVNRSFSISLSGIFPSPTYQIRISSTLDCSTPLVMDIPFPTESPYNVVAKVREAAEEAYLCFSWGTCPTQEEAQPCSQMLGKNAVCLYGCCANVFPEDPSSCWDMVQGGTFTPLSVSPFVVEDGSTLTLTQEIPSDNSDTSSDRETVYLTVTISSLTLCLIVAGITCWLLCSSKRRDSTPDNRYQLVSKLGSGAYGVVYLVKRRSDSVLLAMKYISCSNDTEQQEAMREFTVLRKIGTHPGLIQIFETTMNWIEEKPAPEPNTPLIPVSAMNGSHKNVEGVTLSLPRYVCLVMPYYEEGDLRSYVSSYKGQLSTELILDYLSQLASVLEFLHAATPPVVHRDLKPENVLMAENGTKLVITDFGLARNVEQASYCHTQAGSLPYIAPECWDRKYGTEVDIWALGCIAYAIATKRVEHHTTKIMFTALMKAGQELFNNGIQQDLTKLGYPISLAELACEFLQLDASARPTAAEITKRLNANNDSNIDIEPQDDEKEICSSSEDISPFSVPEADDVKLLPMAASAPNRPLPRSPEGTPPPMASPYPSSCPGGSKLDLNLNSCEDLRKSVPT
eukprot:TRINITY_DN10113_c0_g1_i3.p1 TRINITY_DN10113_c0_g1~~TRINITY_DN10113_c0_g1_i3.p1  ORF type:complete len:939 (+),score=157.68 TRINITY_DN10113_c0_g1_i3:139-2955(+)